MTLVLLLLTVALVGLVVAVAAGRVTGGLADPVTTVPPGGLPSDEVTVADLDALRFEPALRGYRMDQVDDALAALRAELERRDDEAAALRARLAQQETGTAGPVEGAVAGSVDAGTAEL